MAVALLLAHARRVVEGDKRARDPALRKIDSGWFGKQVSGSTVGIVGLGRIGEAIAKRCVALGATVSYHKRTRATAEVEAALGGCEFHASLESLLGSCDFVVLCCPYSADTAKLISKAQLGAMQEGAVLVNIGRGGLVDQLAVADALESGALGGYATDVTEPEPLPVGHPLLSAPRTTITPHTGSATLQTRTAMLNLALDNIDAAIAGTAMPACPNAQALAKR
jgi:glyoxylate reductase